MPERTLESLCMALRVVNKELLNAVFEQASEKTNSQMRDFMAVGGRLGALASIDGAQHVRVSVVGFSPENEHFLLAEILNEGDKLAIVFPTGV